MERVIRSEKELKTLSGAKKSTREVNWFSSGKGTS